MTTVKECVLQMSTTVKIGGMSCGHCVAGVTKALSGIPGVQNLEVIIGQAKFQGNASIDKVKEAIEEEGYEVISVG